MEEQKQNEKTEGRKDDAGKPDWSLLDLTVIEEMVKVLTFGAKHYARDNWKQVPGARNRYYAATLRHLKKYQKGELTDEDSGLDPLAHALCDVYFLLAFRMGIATEVPEPTRCKEQNLRDAVMAGRISGAIGSACTEDTMLNTPESFKGEAYVRTLLQNSAKVEPAQVPDFLRAIMEHLQRAPKGNFDSWEEIRETAYAKIYAIWKSLHPDERVVVDYSDFPVAVQTEIRNAIPLYRKCHYTDDEIQDALLDRFGCNYPMDDWCDLTNDELIAVTTGDAQNTDLDTEKSRLLAFLGPIEQLDKMDAPHFLTNAANKLGTTYEHVYHIWRHLDHEAEMYWYLPYFPPETQKEISAAADSYGADYPPERILMHMRSRFGCNYPNMQDFVGRDATLSANRVPEVSKESAAMKGTGLITKYVKAAGPVWDKSLIEFLSSLQEQVRQDPDYDKENSPQVTYEEVYTAWKYSHICSSLQGRYYSYKEYPYEAASEILAAVIGYRSSGVSKQDTIKLIQNRFGCIIDSAVWRKAKAANTVMRHEIQDAVQEYRECQYASDEILQGIHDAVQAGHILDAVGSALAQRGVYTGARND